MANIDPRTLPPGTFIGPYEVLSRLGKGGFGAVYKVKRGERFFAVKVSSETMADLTEEEREATLARARREVAMLLALSHPNIVRCHAHDYWPDYDSGSLYIVTDLVEGARLYDWQAANHPSLRTLATVFMRIAEGLSAMHSREVFHRDLKSENVLVRTDGEPIIIDLGIARASSSYTMTAADAVVGTFTHFSPDYCRHMMGLRPTGPIQRYIFSPTDDLHALGYMLYEMLCGRPPFESDPKSQLAELIQEIAERVPPPPRSINPVVPPALDSVTIRLLAKDKEARFPTGAALADALAEAITDADETWDVPFAVTRPSRSSVLQAAPAVTNAARRRVPGSSASRRVVPGASGAPELVSSTHIRPLDSAEVSLSDISAVSAISLSDIGPASEVAPTAALASPPSAASASALVDLLPASAAVSVSSLVPELSDPDVPPSGLGASPPLPSAVASQAASVASRVSSPPVAVTSALSSNAAEPPSDSDALADMVPASVRISAPSLPPAASPEAPPSHLSSAEASAVFRPPTALGVVPDFVPPAPVAVAPPVEAASATALPSSIQKMAHALKPGRSKPKVSGPTIILLAGLGLVLVVVFLASLSSSGSSKKSLLATYDATQKAEHATVAPLPVEAPTPTGLPPGGPALAAETAVEKPQTAPASLPLAGLSSAGPSSSAPSVRPKVRHGKGSSDAKEITAELEAAYGRPTLSGSSGAPATPAPAAAAEPAPSGPAWLKGGESVEPADPKANPLAPLGGAFGGHIRAVLKSNLDSRTVGVGVVEAMLTRPYISRGNIVLPSRTMLYGQGSTQGPRFLIQFHRIRLPDGREAHFDGLAMDLDDGKPGLASARRIQVEAPQKEGVGKQIAKDTVGTLLSVAASGAGVAGNLASSAGQTVLNQSDSPTPSSGSEAYLLDKGADIDIFIRQAF